MSNGSETAQPMTCWASTSSAPTRGGSPSSLFSAIASRAAWHSSISNLFAGTKSARDGSSSRWLARPIRCTIRDAPLGLASWITRSTSPQSIPRSSVEVQTTARSSPRAIAASTFRRCSAARLPWCRAIGRLSSFSRHSSWNANSAWNRVLTNTSAIRLRLMTS